MKFYKTIFVVLLAVIIFAACSPAKAPIKYAMGESASTGCSTLEAGKTAICKVNGVVNSTATPILDQVLVPQPDLTKSDEQGSVTVTVKPLNLDKPGNSLIFDVYMSTHSVDLSMDLTQLAVLTTDSGKTVQAVQWDGPRGGHHVEGKLSFPTTLDGKKLFDGARSITITIKDVDAPIRTFIWQLKG